MHDSRSWAYGYTHFEQLMDMDDIDFRLYIHGSKCYEKLTAMEDMNTSWSWNQGSRFYE